MHVHDANDMNLEGMNEEVTEEHYVYNSWFIMVICYPSQNLMWSCNLRLLFYLIDGPCSNVRLPWFLLIPIHMHLYLTDSSNMLIPATPLALA